MSEARIGHYNRRASCRFPRSKENQFVMNILMHQRPLSRKTDAPDSRSDDGASLSLAARHIARRFGLPPSTAATVAVLAGLGTEVR